MGPVVGILWHAERTGLASIGQLGEAELNTIGYVLSRYGRLTARDLEHMTHAESPWKRADAGRPPSGTANMRREWMQEYFAAEQESDDDGPWPDLETSRRFVEGAQQRRQEPAGLDSVDGLALTSPVVAEPWRLLGFQERLDEWIDQERPQDWLRVVVVNWVLSESTTPTTACAASPASTTLIRRHTGSGDGDEIVCCSLWVEEIGHRVRCDRIATLGWPVT